MATARTRLGVTSQHCEVIKESLLATARNKIELRYTKLYEPASRKQSYVYATINHHNQSAYNNVPTILCMMREL